VRITDGGYYVEDTPWTSRVRRDSVRITGAEETGDTPWGRRVKRDGDNGDGFMPIKVRDDGPDKEIDWGKVKRGVEGPNDGDEFVPIK
jgi:hypothetical protein